MKLFALCVFFAAQLFSQSQPSEQFDYVLSPGENILIHVDHLAAVDGKTFRIKADGTIALPSIGRLQAAGLKIEDLEKAIAKRLHGGAKQRRVSISVVAVSSH